MPRRTALVAATLAATALLTTTHAAPATAAPVPEGAKWTEATIAVTGGVKLHADILRPKDLPDTAKTPVILSIGPYFNHSGQVGPAGPIQDAPYDPASPVEGPSERFYDLVTGGKLFERGYTFVMVDLRGFGGSTGCLDWVGPGEQADVKAAVEWAASRPWSTGKVGMYGKSYDGVTGLVGAIQKPKGLAAVVSQEPVYDMYRYLYANGIRYPNSVATPALYDAIAATPGPLLDSPTYNIDSLNDPGCLAANYAAQQDSNHGSEYWKQRDLITKAKAAKSDVPLFMTQGFLEFNTDPDGTWDFYNAFTGPKRGWFGMFEHVRGNDKDSSGRLLMGREGWFDETMRFFDHYVRDVPLKDAPTDKDPANAIQTSDGKWRDEAAWPPADTKLLKSALKPGTYADDANNSGSGSGGGNGTWTISPPLPHDAHFAGVGRVDLELDTAMNTTNVVVNVYEISPDRKAQHITRGASLVGASGGKLGFDLFGNDWKVPAGHRIGVLVSGSNSEYYLNVPTGQTVGVKSGTIQLPFKQEQLANPIQGESNPTLEEWLKDAPFDVPEATITAAESKDFVLPAKLAPPGTIVKPTTGPTGGGGGGATGGTQGGTTKPGTTKNRLTYRVARKSKRRVTVYGNAPTGYVVTMKFTRGKKTVTKRVKARFGAFRATVRLPRTGTYKLAVTAKKGKTTLRAARMRVKVRP